MGGAVHGAHMGPECREFSCGQHVPWLQESRPQLPFAALPSGAGSSPTTAATYTCSLAFALQVVDSEERAQAISRARAQNAEWHRRAALGRMVAQQQEAAAEGEQRTLPVIIKADVQVGGVGSGPAWPKPGALARWSRCPSHYCSADMVRTLLCPPSLPSPQGSAEAVHDALAHMCTEQVRVQVCAAVV